MQFVQDSRINKASFKHNLHVIVPGLDFFPFVVFSNLFCSSCFYFLVCGSILKVQLLVCTGGNFFLLVFKIDVHLHQSLEKNRKTISENLQNCCILQQFKTFSE